SITIGTGGSVGREGPIIQIGASLGSSVGQFLKISGNRMKTLVGCGAAAGIAAAFNAPIAGALFAVEIILMDFAFAQFSPIVISSVMATVVSHQFEGNFAAFQVPAYQLVNPTELIFYTIMGLVCGLVSFLFIKVLYYSEDLFDLKIKFPEYLKPVIGGVIIGLVALVFPEIMGVGYDSINNALHGRLVWQLALVLIFVKIFTTSVTLGSGGSGGIFAPSLFMGAMLGCFFGIFVHEQFPLITASPGAYALVAMGGLVAGTTRAPITAIIMVFEMTNDYDIILPLMITCIISTILSSKLARESIYTLKLLFRNINLKEGTEINLMKSIFVTNVYTKHFETIPESCDFNEVVNQLITKNDPYFAVLNPKGLMSGLISIHNVKNIIFDKDNLQDIIIAKDLATKEYETTNLDENCQEVLEKMSRTGFSAIPVVDKDNEAVIIGMIWRKDILDHYHQEIERKDIASTLADRIQTRNTTADVHFMEGYSISEVRVPKDFLGKTIIELQIRTKYGVDVLSIRKDNQHSSEIKAFPGPDHLFAENELLIVAGEIKNINILKGLS
ncbi:MAG: chloride channel protein, partial [Deltaproteobacteria bacterium]|nr:chloride channel protein [Deltaproteobacteria bacterium]